MRFLIFIFGIIALYDGFTTFIGTADIMDDSIIISVVFAVIILAIVGSTAFIWSDNAIEEEFLRIFLRFLWFVAIIYDLFTSYVGNLEVLMDGDVSGGQTFILLGLTLLVSSAPVIFSYFLREID